MVKSNTTYDVFISHSRRDAELAAEIARTLRSYDLNVFTDNEIELGERIEDTLWDAIAESQAFVTVVGENEPSASVTFELGAAMAWNKPVYAIASNPSSLRLPAALQGSVIYTPSRVEEIAQEIKRSLVSLSDSEKTVLIDEYHRIGVPIDQLFLQPTYLSRLTKQFTKRTKRQITSEELVRILITLRKKGALPRAKAKKLPKTT